MKKIQLIFSVKQNIEGQAPTQDGLKYTHPQDIEIEIAKAYDSVVFEFFNNPQFTKNFDLDYFCKSYDEKLKESDNILYVSLPVNPIPLKAGLGLRSIKPKNSTVNIVRITEAEFVNLQDLEAFCCSPSPFCYVDYSNDRVVLQVNRSEYKLMEDISMKIIPRFTDLLDDDEVNTPGGDYPLTEMVMKTMGLRPTDNTNDDGR